MYSHCQYVVDDNYCNSLFHIQAFLEFTEQTDCSFYNIKLFRFGAYLQIYSEYLPGMC